MISVLLHPGLVMVLLGLSLFWVQGSLRSIALLTGPVIALWFVWLVPDSIVLSLPFMEWQLEPFEGDKLSRLFATVFSVMAFAGNLYALRQNKTLELIAANVYIGFALGVVFAGDLITVFIFWELMALASTAVIFSACTERARKAGMRYLLVHLLGGVVLMAGIAGEVSQTGSVDFVPMLPDTLPRMLILAGLILNTGAPPFSSWVSDSYPEASFSGMVFLSAFTTKTAVYTLARGFAGAEVLMFIGIYMIFYGIIYGLCENNVRKMLSYSIVNQVGFMVTAIGIGTELAINGAVAHAFAHIIYKALLIMAVGSVLYVTGKRRFTEYGGLFRTMPVTAICCIIGGLSISAFPLTSGFVAKAMMSEAAYSQGLMIVWYMLAAGTVGVFLDVGIKLQYFVFFGADSKQRPPEPPINMRLGMILFAVFCVAIGVFPQQFYNFLPYAQDYRPYTLDHVVTQFQLLMFSGAAFFIFLKYCGWKLVETITIDIDWFWRRPGKYLLLSLVGNTGHARDKAYRVFLVGADSTMMALRYLHGPRGSMARAMPTGRAVFWAVVMLAAYLLFYYLII